MQLTKSSWVKDKGATKYHFYSYLKESLLKPF